MSPSDLKIVEISTSSAVADTLYAAVEAGDPVDLGELGVFYINSWWVTTIEPREAQFRFVLTRQLMQPPRRYLRERTPTEGLICAPE